MNSLMQRSFCLLIGMFLPTALWAAGPGFSIAPAITPQGEPTFPIGWWYNVQRWLNIQTDVEELDQAFAMMAAGGADTIYVAGGPNFTSYHHGLYLTYAAQHNLKLFFMIFRDDLLKIDDPDFGDRQKQILVAAIEADLLRPNFVGYSLGDELLDNQGPATGYVSHAQQQWFMDRVKERNANVMVMQSFGATQPLHDPSGQGNCIEGRVAITDTLAFFRYPFATFIPEFYPIAITNNLLVINEKVLDPSGLVGSRRGLFHIDQAVGDDFDPCNWDFRYPTYDELRYSQWSGIACNRQRGAFYFEFGSLDYLTQGWLNFFNNTATPLMQEQRQLQQALATGWDAADVATNGDGYLWSGRTVRQVGSLLVRDDSQYYLILTNNRNSTNSVHVTLSNLPAPLQNLAATLLHETGTGKDTVNLTPGSNPGEFSFTISMGPYDVDIYQMTWTILGDMNGDGAFTQDDFEPLWLAWTEPAAYASQYPSIDPDVCGDMNSSGQLDAGDLRAFWETLYGDTCSPAPAADINGDCRVDFADFAILVSEWLE